MLGAAIRKDVQLLLRDRGALASLFILPIIFVAAFGAMFADTDSGQPRALAVFVEPGAPPAARGLIAAIEQSGAFGVRTETSAKTVRALVAREDIAVGLIIPAGFDPRAGKPAELVIDEAAPPSFRGPIQGAIEGILLSAYLNPPANPPADNPPPAAAPGALAGGPVTMVEARTPPGLDKPLQGATGFQISVPGNSVLFGFFLALTVALSFAEERRSGTWRRLLAAPLTRPLLLLAKLVPFTVIGLIQMAFLFGIGALAFDMEIAGSVPAMLALTLAVVLCATALGLLIASFGGTEKQIGGIGSICLLVMGLFGGTMVPRPVMPKTMQLIGLGTPHGWALEGYYDVLVRTGTGLADVWPKVAALLGFAGLFFLVGVLRFRFER